MGEGHAGVDHGDHRAGVTRLHVPCLRSVDVGAARPHLRAAARGHVRLRGVVQPPEVAVRVVRVIRRQLEEPLDPDLGEGDRGIALVRANRGDRGGHAVGAHDVHPEVVGRADQARADLPVQGHARAACGERVRVADDDLAGQHARRLHRPSGPHGARRPSHDDVRCRGSGRGRTREHGRGDRRGERRLREGSPETSLDSGGSRHDRSFRCGRCRLWVRRDRRARSGPAGRRLLACGLGRRSGYRSDGGD